MNDQPKPSAERRLELLADRALAGLTASEQNELLSIGASGSSPAEDEQWDLAAAAGAIALLRSDLQAMPLSLRDRISAAYVPPLPSQTQARRNDREMPRPRRMTIVAAAGWLAAAVLLVALLTQAFESREVPTTDPAAARERLLREAADVRVIAWTPGGPNEPPITGDVVWSDTRQEGYLRFRGLPANDPKRYQYQLWIFDTRRDERFPVDGGVFDVAQATADGDVIVPIRAKLFVGRPGLFALARERPGGVVVSDRKEIACLAKVG
jgi:hypothetical protein